MKYQHLVHIICTMTDFFSYYVTSLSPSWVVIQTSKSERHAESSSVLTPPHVTSACDHEDLPRNCLQKAHWCTFSSTKLPWTSTWPCLGVSFRADDFHLVGRLWRSFLWKKRSRDGTLECVVNVAWVFPCLSIHLDTQYFWFSPPSSPSAMKPMGQALKVLYPQGDCSSQAFGGDELDEDRPTKQYFQKRTCVLHSTLLDLFKRAQLLDSHETLYMLSYARIDMPEAAKRLVGRFWRPTFTKEAVRFKFGMLRPPFSRSWTNWSLKVLCFRRNRGPEEVWAMFWAPKVFFVCLTLLT